MPQFLNPQAQCVGDLARWLTPEGRSSRLGMEAESRQGIGPLSKERAMICPKCSAQMFSETSLRFHSTTPGAAVDFTDDAQSWRCPCGQYLDRTILANRARQADELRLVMQAEAIVGNASRGLHDYGVGPRS